MLREEKSLPLQTNSKTHFNTYHLHHNRLLIHQGMITFTFIEFTLIYLPTLLQSVSGK